MGAIAQSQGLGAVFGATIGAGLIGIALSMVFGKIVRFFPPVVTGSVITVIGLTLLPSAFDWAADRGEGSAAGEAGGGMAAIGLAALTLLIIFVLSRIIHGGVFRNSLLFGIVV